MQGDSRGRPSLRRGEPACPPPAGRRLEPFAGTLGFSPCPPSRWATPTGRARSPRRRSKSARRAGNPMSEAYALLQRRHRARRRGELDDAQRLIEESVSTARELGNLRSVATWTKGSAGSSSLKATTRGHVALRESLAHPPQPRRRVGDLGLALGPRACGPRRTRPRHGAAPARGSLELELKSGRPTTSSANNFEICARLAAAEGRRRPRRPSVRSGEAPSRIDSVGMSECEVGWPDPDTALARSAPRSARKPSPKRGRRDAR